MHRKIQTIQLFVQVLRYISKFDLYQVEMFDIKQLNPLRTLNLIDGLKEAIRLPLLVVDPQEKAAFNVRTYIRKRIYDGDVPSWVEMEDVVLPDSVDVDVVIGDLNDWITDVRRKGYDGIPLGIRRHPVRLDVVQIHWNELPKRQ